MERVINSNSGKKINVGGDLYNRLIKDGYVVKDGVLINTKKGKVTNDFSHTADILSTRPQFYPMDHTVEYYPLPNVRCFECNTPITKYKRYEELIRLGYDPIDVYEQLNIKRVCCRKEYSNPHLEPFPYINQNKIDDVQVKLTKNPKIFKTHQTENVRLYQKDKLLGLKTKMEDEGEIEYRTYKPKQLKTTSIAGGKYFISSAK